MRYGWQNYYQLIIPGYELHATPINNNHNLFSFSCLIQEWYIILIREQGPLKQ